VHDALANGRPFRVLTVVDQWSRQSPILEVASSMSGATVAQTLDRVLPAGPTLRSLTLDHGPEFTSRSSEDWAFQPEQNVLHGGPTGGADVREG
jgi:putative transposase